MRRWITRRLCAVLMTVGCCCCSLADWPQFLGEHRDGTSSETGLIDRFPSDGPEVVWRVQGGTGMSAVTVADGLAITMFNETSHQVLCAFDTQTGERVWQFSLAQAYKNGQGDGPRATAAVANHVVYAFTGEGILCAVNQKTGQMIWRTDAIKECSSVASEYGISSSPLVIADKAIVHVGGSDSAVAAFGIKDGQLKWSTGNGPAGYSSPVSMNIAGTEQVISVTGTEVLGIDPNNGTTLWTYPFETPYACNTANPVAVDGAVFISAGENHGCALIDIQHADGKFVAKQKWESVYSKSVMRNEWQTSVVVDGYLYGFDNVGAAGPITHLACIEVETGKPVWQKKRFGKGNMILADGKLWITTMSGELVLVKVTPDGYEELARAKMFGKTRQSLSIADGFGYIRDDQEILCLKLRPPVTK